MKKLIKNPFILSILGAVCMWAGWPTSPFVPLIFVGMSVFLFSAHRMVEDNYSSVKYFGVMCFGLLLWNVLGSWWIYNSTFAGMAMAVIGNTLLMYLPFMFYRMASRLSLEKLAPFVFLVVWLGYEYLHQNWALNWPWLTLGNGLAYYPEIVQWYEFTGAHGGSLWVLVVALTLLPFFKQTAGKKQFIPLGLVALIPLVASYFTVARNEELLSSYEDTSEIVVLQPNFNTYTQKNGPDRVSPSNQVIQMMIESRKQLTQNTEFLIWPETAINGIGPIQEKMFHKTNQYKLLQTLLNDFPNLTLLSGLNGYNVCEDQTNHSEFASYFMSGRDTIYYESYNSALMMQIDSVSFYHKSKFVPGAEQIPFPWLIKPISVLLGGVNFGHSFGQKEALPFTGKMGTKISPAICYESIFGEYMTGFVNNGAHVHAIMTNDDWWHNTEGHKHHFLYAGLRAIETRREIARSANTGTSGFFDVYGHYKQETDYRVGAVLREEMKKFAGLTFYVKYGDYLSRTACYLAVILMLSLFVKRVTPKRQ